jgi:hypothetical protein
MADNDKRMAGPSPPRPRINPRSENSLDDPQAKSPAKLALETVGNFIEEDLARAHAQYAGIAGENPWTLQDRTLHYLVEVFDIHAHHHRLLICSYRGVKGWYVPYLDTIFKNIMELGEEMTASWVNPPTPVPLDRNDLLRTLRATLTANGQAGKGRTTRKTDWSKACSFRRGAEGSCSGPVADRGLVRPLPLIIGRITSSRIGGRPASRRRGSSGSG